MRFRCSIGWVLLALAGCAPLTPVASEGRPTEIPEPGAPAAPTREGESRPAVPDLVWLPFSNGLDESRSVLVVRSDQVGFETSPVDFSLYWDYSGITGRLAYASEFWHAAEGSNRSVSDLWVYDYTFGKANQWVPDNVGRASWSPMREGQAEPQRLGGAVYDTEHGRYDLVFFDGPLHTQPLPKPPPPCFSPATLPSTSSGWSRWMGRVPINRRCHSPSGNNSLPRPCTRCGRPATA